MQRRHFLTLFLAAGCSALAPGQLAAIGRPERLTTAPQAWRGRVSEQAWLVLFQGATERPWSSPLNDETRPGTYLCAACHLPLFSSVDKYDSGTGWPSFTQPLHADHIATKRDFKLLIPRTEYHCARCGGHQGHVFNDGPAPRGERWCNNGVALFFVPKDESLPELRS